MSRNKNPFNLTDKQRRFCEEYIIDSNGAQACIRAGYSEKTARHQASQLLTKVNVKDYIASLQDRITEGKVREARSIREYWLEFFEVSRDIPRHWIPFEEYLKFPDNWRDCIDYIKERNHNKGTSKAPDYERQVQVVLLNKIQVADQLNKMQGAYKEDNNQKAQGIIKILELPDNGRG